jgi:hypothetical protein
MEFHRRVRRQKGLQSEMAEDSEVGFYPLLEFKLRAGTCYPGALPLEPHPQPFFFFSAIVNF